MIQELVVLRPELLRIHREYHGDMLVYILVSDSLLYA